MLIRRSFASSAEQFPTSTVASREQERWHFHHTITLLTNSINELRGWYFASPHFSNYADAIVTAQPTRGEILEYFREFVNKKISKIRIFFAWHRRNLVKEVSDVSPSNIRYFLI